MAKQLLSRMSYLEQRQYPLQRREYLDTDAKVQSLLEKLNEMYYERLFQETRLQCLALQEKIVQECLNSAKNDSTHWVHAYYNALDGVLKSRIASYVDYLAARKHDNSSVMSVTHLEIQLDSLLSEYYIQEQVFALKENLPEFLADIQLQYQEQDAAYNELFDAIALEGMKINEIDEHWVAFSKKNEAALKSQIKRDLLALAEFGDLYCVKQCVKNIPKKLRKTYLNRSVVTLRDDITQVNTSALHIACLYGHADIVSYLLEQGADPLLQDMEGYLPIHRAVWSLEKDCGVSIIKLFVEFSPELLNAAGIYGRTALHTAAFRGNIAAVNCLIALGANLDVKETTTWMTPLHSAVLMKHAEVVKSLLMCGANPWVRDALQQTALQMAILNCDKTVVNNFISKGVVLSAVEVKALKLSIEKKAAPPSSLEMFQHLMSNYLETLGKPAIKETVSVAQLGQGISDVLQVSEDNTVTKLPPAPIRKV